MPPSPNTRSLRRRFGVLTALLLLAGILIVPIGPATGIPDKKIEERLKNQERKLKQATAQAEELGNEIGRTKAELARTRDRVNALRGEVLIAGAEYDKLVRELEATKAEQETARGELTDIKGDIQNRARSAFIAGPTGGLELILGGETFQDVAQRSTFLNSLQAQDANTADAIQDIAAKLHDLAVEQRVKAREAAIALRYVEKQKEDLQTEAAKEAATVETLNKQLHAANQLVKKWGVKVDKTADKLGYAAIGNGPIFVCPVPNYSFIADDFGAPRVGHTHQGNDIMAPMGADIVAPFDGQAKYSTDSLGGMSVYVYGKDGYVYNTHLSGYEGGNRRVDAGDVIGYVGMTGNAAGTVPHDHFEWHPGGGSAIDPNPYLQSVCRK